MRAQLEKSGVLRVDTKQRILGRKATPNASLCVVFGEKDRLGSVVAFVLTRVLPLVYGYAA